MSRHVRVAGLLWQTTESLLEAPPFRSVRSNPVAATKTLLFFFLYPSKHQGCFKAHVIGWLAGWLAGTCNNGSSTAPPPPASRCLQSNTVVLSEMILYTRYSGKSHRGLEPATPNDNNDDDVYKQISFDL